MRWELLPRSPDIIRLSVKLTVERTCRLWRGGRLTRQFAIWLVAICSAAAPAATPVSSARDASVAAPAVILIDGGNLPQRVALSRRRENIQLLAATTPVAAAPLGSSTRPTLMRVALFWQVTPPNVPLTDALLAHLRFEDADHHGFLVAATSSSPPLLVIDYPPPVGRTFREIHEQGLRVLFAHGIELRYSAR